MGCVKLLKGLDLSCADFFNRYYQQIVLINRSDVDEIMISDTDVTHRISFNLKAGRAGNLFIGNEAGDLFTATFDKSTEKGIPLYTHNVELPVSGASESIKLLLKQIDNSDLFAAVQFKDGTVEIYGFNYGLRTDNYTYEPQGELGGAVIPLTSSFEEYSPPYVYYAKGGLETTHFNNLFANIGSIIGGDFNDDFSDDFDNIYVE